MKKNQKYIGQQLNTIIHRSDSLMYEIKTEDVYKDFNSDEEMFDFSNYLTKSKYFDNLSKLVVCKMKHEAAGVAKNFSD